MGKYSQERFPRLAIVGAHGNKQQLKPAAERWWGPERTRPWRRDPAAPTTPATCYSESRPRTAVMPHSSAGWLVTCVFNLWRSVESYFMTPDPQKRRAAVLSFRRYGLRTHDVRQALAGETFTGKKNNGSVHWTSEEEVSPREGGR